MIFVWTPRLSLCRPEKEQTMLMVEGENTDWHVVTKSDQGFVQCRREFYRSKKIKCYRSLSANCTQSLNSNFHSRRNTTRGRAPYPWIRRILLFLHVKPNAAYFYHREPRSRWLRFVSEWYANSNKYLIFDWFIEVRLDGDYLWFDVLDLDYKL
jgi:hypothetical protein